MKKIVLFLLIPFVFLSSESGKKNKTVRKSEKKTAETKISDRKKNSLKKESESKAGKKRESIVLEWKTGYGRLFIGKNEIPEEVQFLEQNSGKYIPAVNEDGISKIIYKKTDKEYSSLLYDSKGKRAGEVYFRILSDGWEVMKKSEAGFEKSVFNAKGSEVLKETYGADGKLKADESGIASIKYKYNKKGSLLSEEKFDAKGSAKEDKEGIAGRKYKYNKKGSLLSEEKFDEKGRLKADGSGIALKKYQYNEKGDILSEEKFDSNGRLKADHSGIARSVTGYDEQGHKTIQETYGEDGRLKADGWGITRTVFQYDLNCIHLRKDPSMCRTLEEYSDESGKVYLKTVSKYDKNGYRLDEENFGADGKYRNNLMKTARSVFNYNENCIQAKKDPSYCISLAEYYDADGKLNDPGFSQVEYYDADGNLSEFGGSLRHARNVVKFDQKGNRIESEYYGTDGKIKKTDTVRTVYKYSDAGNLILVENYGADGLLIEESSIARKIYEYDEKCLSVRKDQANCRTLVEYWRADGSLQDHTLLGAARTVYAFDYDCLRLKKNTTDLCRSKIEHFGEDGKPREWLGTAKILIKYDEKGNTVLEESYGKDGKLTGDMYGISRTVRKYNTEGYEISSTESDSEGSVVRKEFYPVFTHPLFPEKILRLELDEYFLPQTVKLEDAKKN